MARLFSSSGGGILYKAVLILMAWIFLPTQPAPRRRIELPLPHYLGLAELLVEFNREAGGILFERCDETRGVRDHKDLGGFCGYADQSGEGRQEIWMQAGFGFV